MDEVDALLRLIRAYSPTGRERPAVRVFGEIAQALGYRFRIDQIGNGIATLGRDDPQMMFLGHIDTVEGVIPIRATRQSIAGRGACDAKAALVAALFAGAAVHRSGQLQIVAAVGEERDSRGANYLTSRHRPAYLIVGEPTGWEGITIAYKGELRLSAEFHGKRSHLSSPAPSTADRAVEWVAHVRRVCERRSGPTPFLSVTMKVVEIGSRLHHGAELVKVDLDLRLPPATQSPVILKEITESASRPRITVVSRVDPVEVDRPNSVIQALSAAIRREGGTPTLYRKGGTSDLNTVLPIWDCPAAVYGPGDSHLDHTDRERTGILDLRHAIRVLEGAWTRLEGSSSSSVGSGSSI